MNFFAIPTLKNVRACLRLPSSMMPRFSLKLTLARLRTGIASAGSLLRWAAVITTSATPMSFFSTTPGFFDRAMTRLSLLSPGGPGRPGRLARPGPGLPPRRLGLVRLRRALVRRHHIARLGARQHRRVPFGPLGGDDDRVREPLRAALAAQDLVGAGPAGPLQGDPVQLALELLAGQPAALQPGARLDDLLDVQLEDVAPAELGLGPLAPPQEHPEPAPALLQREPDLLADLVVVGDRFLGLAGERDPHRGHVDQDHHGAGRQRAAGLGDAVVPPVGLEHGLEGPACRLLVEEGDPVGVADDARQLVVALRSE